jgi:sulfopyruvate decarboxylase TPP-binding subunit
MPVDAKGREIFPQVADSDSFAAELQKHCDWFSAVPDSCIKAVLPKLPEWQFAPRENHAVALAFGARIAGKKPCLLLQNSGLGLALDALLGLFGLYRQGLLLVVSNRGELAWEEIQHQDWGDLTLPLLQQTDWPLIDYQQEGLPGLARAAELAFEQQKIAVLVLHRGNLDE